MYEIHKQLERVLGEAQNGPPDGAADGSLNEAEWTALSDFDHRLSDLIFEIEEIQRWSKQ